MTGQAAGTYSRTQHEPRVVDVQHDLTTRLWNDINIFSPQGNFIRRHTLRAVVLVKCHLVVVFSEAVPTLRLSQ